MPGALFGLVIRQWSIPVRSRTCLAASANVSGGSEEETNAGAGV
jgi:hypothetical protein